MYWHLKGSLNMLHLDGRNEYDRGTSIPTQTHWIVLSQLNVKVPNKGGFTMFQSL